MNPVQTPSDTPAADEPATTARPPLLLRGTSACWMGFVAAVCQLGAFQNHAFIGLYQGLGVGGVDTTNLGGVFRAAPYAPVAVLALVLGFAAMVIGLRAPRPRTRDEVYAFIAVSLGGFATMGLLFTLLVTQPFLGLQGRIS